MEIFKSVILVTGGTGMVGSAIKSISDSYPEYQFIYIYFFYIFFCFGLSFRY